MNGSFQDKIWAFMLEHRTGNPILSLTGEPVVSSGGSPGGGASPGGGLVSMGPADTSTHRPSAGSIRCEPQGQGLHVGCGQSAAELGDLWGMKGSGFEDGSSCQPGRYL